MREELKRDYNFSDARLVNLTNEKINFAERDETQFTQYGFTPIHRTALQTFCDNFENLPDDMEFESDKMIATEEKQEARQKLEIWTRQIMQRVETAFGLKSGQYRRFGTKGLSKQSDDQLHKTGNRVVRCANHYFSQLSAFGLTQAMINGYRDLVQLYEERLEVVKDKISDRDIATQQRIEMGNTLYSRLMGMCGMGKTIWEDASEAHYNDYVIYNTPSGTNEAEEENIPPTPPQ